MWTNPTRAWVCHQPEFLGDSLDRDRATGPWSGHRFFAYDLLRWRQPEVVVELGTHYGVSLLAILQALRDADAAAAVHAVDTWEGDEHAGLYGPEVLTLLKDVLGQAGLSAELHQRLFSEALADFEDESVDLIHIDGLHTYEALAEDFTTWLPKLAPGGLMLLHDVDPASGYGSAQYYRDEIADRYPGFAFRHNFGLGVVLPKGVEGWEYLLSDEFSRWRAAYEWAATASEKSRMVTDLTRQVEDRDTALQTQAALIDERDNALVTQSRMIDERDVAIERAEAEIDARDDLISKQDGALRELEAMAARLPYLEALEASPKLQVRALARTVPRTISRRTRAFRTRKQSKLTKAAETSDEPPRAPEFPATGSSLEALIQQHLDPQWYATTFGVPPELAENDYWEVGLPRGRPVSAAHERALAEVNATREPEQASSASAAQLLEAVATDPPELVTVDVWDTLLFRTRPADAAKTATAARLASMPLFAEQQLDVFELVADRVRIEQALASSRSSQEYELTEVLSRQLGDLGTPPELAPAVAADLARAEVDDECRNTWVDTQLWEALESLGCPVVLLSDFYIGAAELTRILSEAAGTPLPWPLVVSVDVGMSKRMGGLFERVRKEHGVRPEKHLHMGDNPVADVANQRAGGGRAEQVSPEQRFPAPGSYTAGQLAEVSAELQRRLREVVVSSGPQRAGRDLALLAVGLINAAVEDARQLGADRVHYVSREGLFLAQVHAATEPILRRGAGSPVASVHLEASRLATFAASLHRPYFAALQRMWSMYGTQSMDVMLASLGLSASEFASQLRQVGLAAEQQITNPGSDSRVRAFLELPEVDRLLTAHIEESRELLTRYVDQISEVSEPFLVVDIGWRGSIQDNIVRALSIRRSHGRYFGLFPFLNPQPPGTTKSGTAFDGNRGDYCSYAEPPAVLERPWTPDVASTIGYHSVGNRVLAVKQDDTDPAAPGVSEFQKTTTIAAPIVAQWIVDMGLTTRELRPLLAEMALSLWQRPPAAIADMWFDSEHDDTFGAMNVTGFHKIRPDSSWRAGTLREHVTDSATASKWPNGYLRWRPVEALVRLAEAD